MSLAFAIFCISRLTIGTTTAATINAQSDIVQYSTYVFLYPLAIARHCSSSSNGCLVIGYALVDNFLLLTFYALLNFGEHCDCVDLIGILIKVFAS